jgi:hypothetical protein
MDLLDALEEWRRIRAYHETTRVHCREDPER